MSNIIEYMNSHDLPEVAALEKKVFSEPWTLNGFQTALDLDYTLYLTVRSKNGTLLGYCGLQASFEEADITNVCVAPEFRRQGIAREMLTELMKRGRDRGIKNYTLEVRAGNKAALELYEQLGFASAGIRPGFYERPKEDAVIMWKYG